MKDQKEDRARRRTLEEEEPNRGKSVKKKKKGKTEASICKEEKEGKDAIGHMATISVPLSHVYQYQENRNKKLRLKDWTIRVSHLNSKINSISSLQICITYHRLC